MVLLLTRQSRLKTFLPPTAVNLLTKMNGHQTYQTLTLLIYSPHNLSGELCLNAIQDTSSQAKERRTDENVLQVIWDQLPQVSINQAIVSFTKRIRASLKAGVDTLNMLCDKLEKMFQFLMKDDVI